MAGVGTVGSRGEFAQRFRCPTCKHAYWDRELVRECLEFHRTHKTKLCKQDYQNANMVFVVGRTGSEYQAAVADFFSKGLAALQESE